MSNVEEVPRESTVEKGGQRGLMRLNALNRGGFETADGKPDLPGTSAASVAVVTKRPGSGGQPGDRHALTGAETPVIGGREIPAAFAKYFAADPNHVRDIVDEARRIRAAMGKSMSSRWTASPEGTGLNKAMETDSPSGAPSVEKAPVTGIAIEERAEMPEADRPVPEKALAAPAVPAENRLRPARIITEPLSAVDEEIRRFAYGRTACTSMDIMDFISHLKDKGYSLQEYIVLEKIYVTIEERKKEARFAIEKEIEGLIAARKAPEEPEIKGLLRRLGEAGLVFEEEDVRRMIRGAVLRRA